MAVDSLAMLSGMVQREHGFIVGPISRWLGYVLNFIFNITFNFSEGLALGLSIIIFTIIIKISLLPLAIKSYKAMAKIQALQPEMEKINQKYGKSKDPEIQRKKGMEIQKLYSENKANPIGGCLPLFIQLPILMSLFSIMNQPYLFIAKLGELYNQLGATLMSIPNFYAPIQNTHAIGLAKIPRNIELVLSEKSDLLRLLNTYTAYDWQIYLSQLPAEFVPNIEYILSQKNQIEQFMSISLVENAGFSWPSILIPIITMIAMFGSSYLTTKQNKSKDPNVLMQQKIMLYVMPAIIGIMTINMPAGVGLYWAASNIFQMGQQLAFMKFFKKDSITSQASFEPTTKPSDIIDSTAVEVKDDSSK